MYLNVLAAFAAAVLALNTGGAEMTSSYTGAKTETEQNTSTWNTWDTTRYVEPYDSAPRYMDEDSDSTPPKLPVELPPPPLPEQEKPMPLPDGDDSRSEDSDDEIPTPIPPKTSLPPSTQDPLIHRGLPLVPIQVPPTTSKPASADPKPAAIQLQEMRDTRIRAIQQENIENVGKAARRLRDQADTINKTLRDSVTRDVNTQLELVDATIPENTVEPFNVGEREEQLKTLREKIEVRKDQLSTEVRDVLTASTQDTGRLQDLNSVLKSSLQDIELLIESETGSDVDLSVGSRLVAPAIAEQAEQFVERTEQLQDRGGLMLYTDSDRDGVSDFDEVNLYHTNPHQAHTAGSSLTDGERILLGLDARTVSSELVPVESPQEAGEVVTGLFEVVEITRPAPQPSPNELFNEPPPPELLTFAGAGLPNSFVTLYIFSTPIVVTVKTDSEGRWKYTMDVELEDGAHELHVAMVDNEGRILAKSPAVPFVQTAEAIEFAPLLSPITPDPNPIDIVREYFVALSILGFFCIALLALVILGLFRRGEPQAQV